MDVLRTILLVVFVIICVFLVLLVLIQNEESNGMGSAFGGGQNVAFGARSASVLTKTTGVFVALFFVIAFVFGLLNRPSSSDDLSGTATRVQNAQNETDEESSSSWLENELSGKTAVEHDGHIHYIDEEQEGEENVTQEDDDASNLRSHSQEPQENEEVAHGNFVQNQENQDRAIVETIQSEGNSPELQGE